jgi:hypothetical protein
MFPGVIPVPSPGFLPKDHYVASALWMEPHDSVMASGADETCLLTVMRSAVLVVLHTSGELHSAADRSSIQQAIKISPLPTILAPRFTSKGLTDSSGE